MNDRQLLLAELTRLNRQGVINDEEFLVLRRMIADARLSGRAIDDFHRLFTARTPGPGAEKPAARSANGRRGAD